MKGNIAGIAKEELMPAGILVGDLHFLSYNSVMCSVACLSRIFALHFLLQLKLDSSPALRSSINNLS
jgi:hypothetical protein